MPPDQMSAFLPLGRALTSSFIQAFCLGKDFIVTFADFTVDVEYMSSCPD